MLASKPINGFAPTKDSKAARSFYESVLGLKFLSENPYVLVMKANDTRIILQKVDQFVPAPYTILGWEVDDIEEVVSFLTNRGVVFERFAGMEQDALGIWKSPEGKVAWFKDPDGNVLSVSQH